MHKRTIILLLLTILLSIPSHAENPICEVEHSVFCGASWSVAFYASRLAHESVSDNCGEHSQSYSKLHRISQKDLDRLKKVLADTKFNELPDLIEPKTYVTDEDMFILRVQMPWGRKTVSAYGLERSTQREYAQRFKKVWETITSILKEPKYE